MNCNIIIDQLCKTFSNAETVDYLHVSVIINYTVSQESQCSLVLLHLLVLL